jgi:hypothetical protein
MSDNKPINIYAVGAVFASVVFGVLLYGGIFSNTEVEETPVTEEVVTVEAKTEEIVVTANEKDLTLDKIHEAAIVNKVNADVEKSETTD